MAASSFRADNSILTGSLTEVTSGTPFLNAGNNIEISTNASGQTTINNPLHPTFIENGLFQSADLSSGVVFIPTDDSNADGARSNIRLYLASTKIAIEKFKIRFNSFTSDGGTDNIAAGIYIGNNGNDTVSAVSLGGELVTINQTLSSNTVYTFDFTTVSEGNNIVEEDQIWSIGLSSTTNVNLNANIHFSILYRQEY